MRHSLTVSEAASCPMSGTRSASSVATSRLQRGALAREAAEAVANQLEMGQVFDLMRPGGIATHSAQMVRQPGLGPGQMASRAGDIRDPLGEPGWRASETAGLSGLSPSTE